MPPRRPLIIPADQVARVRVALGETQLEFSDRFYRSRFSIIRWESQGVKFKYKSIRFQIWRRAVADAIEQTEFNFAGTLNEQSENLRTLRTLSSESKNIRRGVPAVSAGGDDNAATRRAVNRRQHRRDGRR